MTTADATRSPAGTESAWAYTHVPHRIRGDAGEDALTRAWDRVRARMSSGRRGSTLQRGGSDIGQRMKQFELSGGRWDGFLGEEVERADALPAHSQRQRQRQTQAHHPRFTSPRYTGAEFGSPKAPGPDLPSPRG